MNKKELLKQEKGKYDDCYTYYEEYKKHLPFYLEHKTKDEDMKVIDYFYQTNKHNNKTYKILIIIWKKY